MNTDHFRSLELMYRQAPLHKFYKGIEISISPRSSEIILEVNENYFHAGGALHGSVYFKLLDDAAYFAGQSVETGYFLLTKNFTIHFKRPVTGGTLIARGKLEYTDVGLFTCSSELYLEGGKLVADGEGQFAISKVLLSGVEGYR